jgi:hypothetical protein
MRTTVRRTLRQSAVRSVSSLYTEDSPPHAQRVRRTLRQAIARQTKPAQRAGRNSPGPRPKADALGKRRPKHPSGLKGRETLFHDASRVAHQSVKTTMIHTHVPYTTHSIGKHSRHEGGPGNISHRSTRRSADLQRRGGNAYRQISCRITFLAPSPLGGLSDSRSRKPLSHKPRSPPGACCVSHASTLGRERSRGFMESLLTKRRNRRRVRTSRE